MYILFLYLFLSHISNASRRGVVVTTAAQTHPTKLEIRFCTGSNRARGVLEICDGEGL